MQYRTYRPGPPLADFVEYLWALRDAPAHSTERIVPSGTLELVVNLQEDALRIYDPATPPQVHSGVHDRGWVLRFQRASGLARRIGAPDWGRLARACGYFDQSHLIHDVAEFTGTSPRRLGPASEEVKELHLAVPDEVKFLQDADRAHP